MMNVFTATEATKIETIYREARPGSAAYYKDEILEATADENGNVIFGYARGGDFEKTAKTNRTNYVTFEIVAGAVNGKTFGINWANVKTVSGKTYGIKEEIKKAGFAWNGVAKNWVRK